MVRIKDEGGVSRPLEVFTFKSVVEKSELLRTRFLQRDWKIKPTSAMGQLFNRVKRFSDQWEKDRTAVTREDTVAAGYVHRIVEAVLGVIDLPEADGILHKIHRNSFDLGKITQSTGKDLFWELELFHRLALQGHTPQLSEPDLVVDFDFGKYSIACKKVYSLNQLSRNLRKGAKQIKSSGLPGMVALNIDDQCVDKYISGARTTDDILAKASLVCREFNESHKSVWLPMILDKHFDAVMICVHLSGAGRDSGLAHMNCSYCMVSTNDKGPIGHSLRLAAVRRSFESIDSRIRKE
ncbi:hypothetical protein ACOTCG_26930 [Achromobacter xylosoxidans]